MSCAKATSPINIVGKGDGNCNLKCKFSFSYPSSNLIGTNKGEYSSFRPTPTPTLSPVIFNADKYIVDTIRLYHPSLHTYSGEHQSAELIIVHTNINGPGNLLVCIPINKTIQGSGNETLDVLISQMSLLAPIDGGSTGEISLTNFNIGDFIPQKPFFSYVGTLPFTPCTGTNNFVVFNKTDALTISPTIYNKLIKIQGANTYTTHTPSMGVFYNSNGPASSGSGDGIYIECKPTGSSGEVLGQPNNPQEFNLQNLVNSPIFQYILGAFIMILIIKIGSVIFSNLNSTFPSRSQIARAQSTQSTPTGP